MKQSDQSQRWIIPATPSYPQQQNSQYLPAQDQDRLAVLAFIEYVQAFQEEKLGKELYVPFDTGTYYVSFSDLSGAIYFFAVLVNESLRKKTLARIGKKLMGFGGIKSLMQSISSYLGFYNLALAGYESTFSLAHLIDERPSGFLEPLTDAEWQTLSEKAVADMLERRQQESYRYDGFHTTYRDNETATNFSDKRYNKFCHFFGSAKQYPFANDEAKHAAEAIVATEKVRLNLFLEALQGTLRFLDRLTRLPNYTEVQLVLDVNKDRAKVAAEITDLLKTLIGESGSSEEETVNKSDQKTSIVESKATVFPSQDTVCRIKKVEQKGLSHIYYLEVTDPGVLPEPCEFTLTYQQGSSVEEVSLHEVESDE